MSYLPIDPAVLIASATAIAAILLYLREYNLRRKDKSQGDKILEQFQQKGLETLHDSIKKSQAILGEAELEGIKMAAETKLDTAKLEAEYQKKLEETQNQLMQYMAGLQERSKEFEQASQKAIQDRINQIFVRLEERMGQFLITAEEKTTSSIELELKSARQLIETYKSQQLKLIDENILAMMEQTLNLVLGKKLSLKDQLDLIYEALEQAKGEKFIV